MPHMESSQEIFHLYPDGTQHVLHLRACMKRTVLLTQYEAVRVELKRPLKPSVALIVVSRMHTSEPWKATLVKSNGRTREVPLSVLFHRPDEVAEAATTATPTKFTGYPDTVSVSSPTAAPSATCSQGTQWGTTGTASIVSVKEVAVGPHVYSSTEQLFQQVNDMVDVTHPNIVRVLTTATHNGIFIVDAQQWVARTALSPYGACASGSIEAPEATIGVTLSRDPSVILVEHFCGNCSVAECLAGPPRPQLSEDLSRAQPTAAASASPSSTPGNRFSEVQVAVTLYDLLRALRYLHGTCRRCHRRVNTANLLLDSKHGKVVLRQSWEYADGGDLTVKSTTRTGTHLSAPAMSPSSPSAAAGFPASGGGNAYAEDVWMLGVTALEMILGGEAADRFHRAQRIAVAISSVTSTPGAGAAVTEDAFLQPPPTKALLERQKSQLAQLYPEVVAGLSDDLFDLLSASLNADPALRASAEALLSHRFFAATRAQTLVERSRILGSIMALSEPPQPDPEANMRQRENRTRTHLHGASGPSRGCGSGSDDDGDTSSIVSAPSTVAAYRSTVARRGDRTSLRNPTDDVATADVSAESRREPPVDERAASPTGAWSTTGLPLAHRHGEMNEKALKWLKAGYLRAMRGPSTFELEPTAHAKRPSAVIPDAFQFMVSSFPTQPRYRRSRRRRSMSVASSIESVGLRSFPITFTILDPAMDATVSFLETVSIVLTPLSTKDLMEISHSPEWPYDMRRVRHYLRTTGPTPLFEEVLSRLQMLQAQCKQLHNASPTLTLLFIRTLALNYRNLEHGRNPFLSRFVRLESDVARRLQQHHQRRTRSGPVSAASRSPPRGAKPSAATSLAVTPRRTKGGRDGSPSRPSSAGLIAVDSVTPTLKDVEQVFAADAVDAGMAPIAFATAPTGFRSSSGEEAGADDEPRGNAAFFLYSRWLANPAARAF